MGIAEDKEARAERGKRRGELRQPRTPEQGLEPKAAGS